VHVRLEVTQPVRLAVGLAHANYAAARIPFNIGCIAGKATRTAYHGYYAPTTAYWVLAVLVGALASRYRLLPPAFFFKTDRSSSLGLLMTSGAS